MLDHLARVCGRALPFGGQGSSLAEPHVGDRRRLVVDHFPAFFSRSIASFAAAWA